MDPGNRKNDRKAVGLLVQLKHPDVGTFAQEFAVNLSPGGMFIRSRQPQPVGTPVRFEVQIAGGVRVMRGQAVVRWTRPVGDLAGAPGMGVEFTEVDAPTRTLIDRMLAQREQEPEPMHPEAAALEAELKARYGAPGSTPASVAAPPRVPGIAPLSPVARVTPPPALARPAPPPTPQPDAELSDLFGDVDLLASPPPGDLPPLELDYSPPSANTVDIPLEELIADTPAPAPAPRFEEEQSEALDLELDLTEAAIDASPHGDEEVLELELVDGEPEASAAPAPKVKHGPSGMVEFDLEAAADEPLELELAERPGKRTPPPPRPAAPARASAPAAGAAPGALPSIRREAPRAAAAAAP
ncbi:MAG TPA: TIGR02266 family protein, partial [Aggregicoccus sp.]|nr:TIGR02266 family protein [Aggregicoccus sp.]